MLLESIPKVLWHVVVTKTQGTLTFTTREEAREYKAKLKTNGYIANIFKQDIGLSKPTLVS